MVECVGLNSIDVGSLTDEQLFDIRDAAHGVLCVIAKASTVDATMALEKQMITVTNTAWVKAASAGINDNIGLVSGATVTQAKVDTFLDNLGTSLATPLTATQITLLQKNVKSIWETAKKITSKEAKFTPSFSLFDREAVKALNKQQVFWIGGFYDENLSKRIRAVSNDVLIKQGLGHAEAAKALRRELGVVKGGKTNYAASVPARYAGNPQLYFEQVVSTAAHQGRTFASITAMDEAGVIAYRLTNPLDRRTGQRCQLLAGQVFTVSAGKQKRDSILGAKDPADVKNIAPWLSPSALSTAVGGASRGSADASARLQEVGTVLPPFHGKCRTEVVIISGPSPVDHLELGTPQGFPDGKAPTLRKLKRMSPKKARLLTKPKWEKLREILSDKRMKAAKSILDNILGLSSALQAEALRQEIESRTDPSKASVEKVLTGNVKIFMEGLAESRAASEVLGDLIRYREEEKTGVSFPLGSKKGKLLYNSAVEHYPPMVSAAADADGLQVSFGDTSTLIDKLKSWKSSDAERVSLFENTLFSGTRAPKFSAVDIDNPVTGFPSNSFTFAHGMAHYIDMQIYKGRITELFKYLPTEYVTTSEAHEHFPNLEALLQSGGAKELRVRKTAPKRVKMSEIIFGSDDSMRNAMWILARASALGDYTQAKSSLLELGES